MDYCTEKDLINRFGNDALRQATARSDNFDVAVPDSAATRQAALDCALADAHEEVNGYLRGLYPVPLPEVPASIRRCAADIAFYYLHANTVNELAKERYDGAIRLLGQIAAGRVRLGISIPAGQDAIRPVEGFEGTRKVFGGQY